MTARSATPAPSTRVAPRLADIQAPVRDELDGVAREIRRIVYDDSPLIAQVTRHLMAMKGKLFRPTIALLASATDGRPAPRITTLAAVLELMHVATLVHDDAVDHSSLRRGLPTINALFNSQTSVIAGDFLYLRALRELATLGDLDALRVLTDASVEMTQGELRQLTKGDPLQFTEEDYEALIAAKTASLFRAACAVGALCGAGQYADALSRYGQRLGMAFQIVDDLLDYTEAQEVTGKPMGLDLHERKMTLPLIAAMREMDGQGRRRVEALFASDVPSEADIREVIGLVSENGGLDYARHRGERFAQAAEEALADIPETAARTGLIDAIAYVTERRS